ncbi:MAG: TonB-dependent receptor [Acidobacteriaceae bacterium]|nr:TonB-dependent receptor [Acidobacteriaceae bacterium]
MLRVIPLLIVLLVACHLLQAQSGFVKSGDQPIPGASMTAAQGDKTFSTVTDADGHYAFPPLGPGKWQITVDMFGFNTLKQDVDYAAASGPVNFTIQLKESPALQRLRQFAARQNGAGGPGGNRAGGGGAFPGGRRNGAPQGGTTDSADAQLDQEIQNELNAQGQSNVVSRNAAGENTDAFLLGGSLSPGMAQGREADSGPDMRFFGGGPDGQGGPGAPGFPGTATAPGTQNGGAPGFGGGAGGPGGFGGGGFGGRGGGGGGFGGGGFGRGQRGPGRPGQVAGATFGNRRRRTQTIHGQASFTLTNSAVNAKPFSINGLDIPQAAYAQSRFSIIVGGPLVLGKVIKDPKTQFFLTYFGTRSRTPQLFTETVPTSAERTGDFSAATQSLGTNTSVPVTLFDPTSHQPIPGNRIPQTLLSPIALELINRFYPLPNHSVPANNYQYETAAPNNTDNVGIRVQRNITGKDRLSGNVQYQRRDNETAQPFGYFDPNSGYGLNTQLQWTRNLSSIAVSNTGVRFNRNYTEITPYFSTLGNVSAALGIPGTSSDPLDYGPPTLNFTNYGSLSDANPTLNRNQTLGVTESVSMLKHTHSIALGVGYTRADLNTRTDPNARGTFNFTGVATSYLTADGKLTGPNGQIQPYDPNGLAVTGTGFDLADFLLGYPQSSTIQYSSENHYFRQNQVNFYAQDEWKVRSNLTLILGVRYDFFSPFTEKYGRMANLDIAPGYTAVYSVTAGGTGPYSGAFPNGLINADKNNWSPRTALAWKLPWTKRSTVVRAGYGIYYNDQAYIQFANLLANQPPFAVANSVNTSTSNVLTLPTGFLTTQPGEVTNTFAVDKNYRTPYAGTWNVSIQHDFAGGFFVEIGYLGTKGTRLDVRTIPNQQPPGSIGERNQLGNAVGFTYDQSIGNSIFQSGHLRLVRRFNHGISLNAFYQYAKSIDDSSTFGGVGNTAAQNWLDISAERGLSSFDVRHQFSAQFVWTSPVGNRGSRLSPDTTWGRLLKDWQLSGAVTAQTGNPLTARALGTTSRLAQTNGTGSERADATGESVSTSDGLFNLAAFTVPPPGSYGNAGRNTIEGPGLFNLNVAFARSFNITERKRVEFRVESNNVLNHVNYTNYYTVVNATNYGLPSAAGGMRTLDAVVRFRF